MCAEPSSSSQRGQLEVRGEQLIFKELAGVENVAIIQGTIICDIVL